MVRLEVGEGQKVVDALVLGQRRAEVNQVAVYGLRHRPVVFCFGFEPRVLRVLLRVHQHRLAWHVDGAPRTKER